MEDFERFARAWIKLVNTSGGEHHGYVLPSEGASDVASALFTFPSLAAYEEYRTALRPCSADLAAARYQRWWT